MPETPYTEYCNHAFQLTQDVRKVIERDVAPAIDAVCMGNPDADPKHYRVVQYPFVRILRWLMTFEKLNSTRDMQAIGAGARCIFEHHLDLRWLHKFPEEKWFVCFREFPNVDRYMAAKKVIDHKLAHQDSQIDPTPHEGFVQHMDAAEPMAARVLRIWGPDKKGNPRWPRDHWTGEGNLRERAKKIGPEWEDAYVQIYPTLCALVHPGPTPEHGDLAWLEKQVGFGYFLAFVHAKAATEVICELLDIRGRVADFVGQMRQLEQWATEAMAKLPRTS